MSTTKYMTQERAQELVNQIKSRLALKLDLAGGTMTGELKAPSIELGQNALGTATNLFEIGGGADADHKANLFSVDNAGNVIASGEITDGHGNRLSDIVAKATKAYVPKGTIEFTSLPTPAAANEGNVYNVINTDNTDPSAPVLADFEINANFIEYVSGAAKQNTYPSGTNIAVVNFGTDASPNYKYDVLSGFIDTQAIIDSIGEVSASDLEDMWGD